MKGIGFPVDPLRSRRPWFFNATAAAAGLLSVKPTAWGPTLHAHPVGAQVGGFVTSFDTGTTCGLSFVTIRDSGHMTPAYAPVKTQHTVERLLVGAKPLAPPMPHGWDDSSHDEFYGTDKPGTFASWVQRAMSAAFLCDPDASGPSCTSS